MKILLPADGSAESFAAAEFAAKRAAAAGRKSRDQLILLYVRKKPLLLRTHFFRKKPEKDLKKEADKVFAPYRKLLKAAGLKATELIRTGAPGEEIAKAAAKEKPDLIVMGSRGLTPYQGILFGSVTADVIGRVVEPVLLLREEGVKLPENPKIGIAVDGTELGLEAVRQALSDDPVFPRRNASYTVFNVISDLQLEEYSVVAASNDTQLSKEDVQRLAHEDFEQHMKSVRALFAQAGEKAEEVMLEGDPRDRISEIIRERQFDYLIMGSHGYSRFRSVLEGSVVMHVASEETLPLLVVQLPEEEGQPEGSAA